MGASRSNMYGDKSRLFKTRGKAPLRADDSVAGHRAMHCSCCCSPHRHMHMRYCMREPHSMDLTRPEVSCTSTLNRPRRNATQRRGGITKGSNAVQRLPPQRNPGPKPGMTSLPGPGLTFPADAAIHHPSPVSPQSSILASGPKTGCLSQVVLARCGTDVDVIH